MRIIPLTNRTATLWDIVIHKCWSYTRTKFLGYRTSFGSTCLSVISSFFRGDDGAGSKTRGWQPWPMAEPFNDLRIRACLRSRLREHASGNHAFPSSSKRTIYMRFCPRIQLISCSTSYGMRGAIVRAVKKRGKIGRGEGAELGDESGD